MLTIRARLFAALAAICDRLLLPPGASPLEVDAAVRDAYMLAHDALDLQGVWDTEESQDLERHLEGLPD